MAVPAQPGGPVPAVPWRPLAAIAAAVVAAAVVGILPRWPGLVHLVALPPLDLFGDLRVLLARAPGHPAAIVGLVVALAVRVLLLSALLGGPDRRTLRLAAALHGVALVPLLLAAQLGFIAQAVLYSRLQWAAVVLAGVVAAALVAAPWTGEPTLRRALARAWRHGLRLWPVLVHVAVLLGLGALAEVGGGWAAVALVPVAAAATWVCATWLRRPPGGRPALRAVTAVAAVAALVAVQVQTRGAQAPADPPAQDGSLVLMSGINSASGEGAIFELPPEALGFDCDQTHYVSYAGRGGGQPRGVAACPITTGAPYEPADTQRPFAEQVTVLSAQLGDLDGPITLIAHSQAAWVAWQAAAEGRLPDGTRVVLLGPFPNSAVGYPPPGATGEAALAGDLLRLLAPLSDLVDFDFEPDAPLARELLAEPGAASRVLDRPLPADVRALSITSTTDVVLMPDGWRIDGAQDVCPVREAHPYLPITPATHRAVVGFLDGAPPEPCPWWTGWLVPLSRQLAVPPSPDRP